jgi:hypothetical protein
VKPRLIGHQGDQEPRVSFVKDKEECSKAARGQQNQGPRGAEVRIKGQEVQSRRCRGQNQGSGGAVYKFTSP